MNVAEWAAKHGWDLEPVRVIPDGEGGYIESVGGPAGTAPGFRLSKGDRVIAVSEGDVEDVLANLEAERP